LCGSRFRCGSSVAAVVIIGGSVTLSCAAVDADVLDAAVGELTFVCAAVVAAVVFVSRAGVVAVAVEVDSDVEVVVSTAGTVTCVDGAVSLLSVAVGKEYAALSVESNEVSEETSAVAARVPHPDNRNIIRIKPKSILYWRMDHPSRCY